MQPYTIRQRRANIDKLEAEAYPGQKEVLLQRLIDGDLVLAEQEREQAAVARAGGRLLTSKLADRVEDFRTGYQTVGEGERLGEHIPGDDSVWIAALRGDRGQDEVNRCWSLMIDPAYSSSFKDAWTSAAERAAHVGTFSGFGPEDPNVTAVMLHEAEAMLSWPIYQTAFVALVETSATVTLVRSAR